MLNDAVLSMPTHDERPRTAPAVLPNARPRRRLIPQPAIRLCTPTTLIPLEARPAHFDINDPKYAKWVCQYCSKINYKTGACQVCGRPFGKEPKAWTDMKPKTLYGHSVRGRFLAESGRHEDAIENLTEWIKRSPKSATAYAWRSSCHRCAYSHHKCAECACSRIGHLKTTKLQLTIAHLKSNFNPETGQRICGVLNLTVH